MNSEKPLTPGEELEIRITALLMGELSSEEAATLRGQFAENAELQALHTRLSNAFDLLRAAVPLGDTSEQSQPARLSNERRERLLKRFKATSISRPNIVPLPKTKKRWTWLAPLSWAASFIVAIGILVWQMNESNSGFQASSKFGARPAVSMRMSDEAPAARFPDFISAQGNQPPAEEPRATLAYQAPPSPPASAAPAPQKPPSFPMTPSTPVSGDKIDEANLTLDTTASDYTGMPYYRGRGIEQAGKPIAKRATPAPAVRWDSQPGAVRSQVRSGALADANGPESSSLFGASPAATGQPAAPDIRTAGEGTFWDSKPADKPSEPARPAGGSVSALGATGSISDRERALVAEREKLATELAEAKAESKDLKSSLGQMEEDRRKLSMSISDGIDPAKVVELAMQNQRLAEELKEARKGKDTAGREAAELQSDGEKLVEELARSKMALGAAPEGADMPAPDAAARGESPVAANKPAESPVIAGRNFAGLAVDDALALQRRSEAEKGDKSGAPATPEQPVTTGGVAGATSNPPGSAPQKSRTVGEAMPVDEGATRGYAGKAMGGGEIAVSKEKSQSGPVGSTKSEAAGDALVTLDAFDADQDGKELKPASGPMTGTSRADKDLLLQADGFADTGRLDLAKQRVDQVLASDPLNVAARELKERIDSKANPYGDGYTGPAYNETRSGRNLKLEAAWAEPTRDSAADSKAGEDVVSNGRQDWFFKQDGTLAKLGETFESSVEFAPPQIPQNVQAQPAEPALGLPAQRQITLSKEVDAPAATPKLAPPVPQPEVATSENAFSTFLLNVSDVAFKLAAASLVQGKMPEPAAIRSEEFINAFNYRDPEPAAGAPLAFAAETARYPFAQNRDLLRLSVKTAAVGRQVGRPLNLVLLVDNSGSMERADRVRILRESLRILAEQLQPQDKLSIITFARTPRLWVDGVPGNQAVEATQRVGEITPQGGTNLSAALNLAYETARRYYQAANINRVVLLTDGAANLGNVNPTALKAKVEAERKKGIALDCFGVGWEGYNDDLLEQLSRNGDGRYGFINSPDAAATEFASQLAGALRVAASDVKVQVEFNPKRVTAYRQVGYAKHQLTKEQFRDNTVDAAEIGAAESGNALYVIEVNPRGEGDLAIVRARFKVPGTSDYREHEWTVPFSPNTPALEQASPALRLAATASAFSESLAGSPYATEVTSDKLLGIINGVPQAFGSDPRPQRLEWMIRQVKSLSGR